MQQRAKNARFGTCNDCLLSCVSKEMNFIYNTTHLSNNEHKYLGQKIFQIFAFFETFLYVETDFLVINCCFTYKKKLGMSSVLAI